VKKRTSHLDPEAIKAENAKILARAQREEGDTFLGPQMTWHRKPNPGGGPCEVCGCPGLRLGVRHRALKAGHDFPGAAYVKTHNDATGGGPIEEHLGWDGKPARRHVGPGAPPSETDVVRQVGPSGKRSP
jgi:hypothetical protein